MREKNRSIFCRRINLLRKFWGFGTNSTNKHKCSVPASESICAAGRGVTSPSENCADRVCKVFFDTGCSKCWRSYNRNVQRGPTKVYFTDQTVKQRDTSICRQTLCDSLAKGESHFLPLCRGHLKDTRSSRRQLTVCCSSVHQVDQTIFPTPKQAFAGMWRGISDNFYKSVWQMGKRLIPCTRSLGKEWKIKLPELHYCVQP